VDCGQFFEGRPYWTGEDGIDDAIDANCAGEFLCPDWSEDATPDHLAVCVGSCGS
jgi:hypothetical protein